MNPAGHLQTQIRSRKCKKKQQPEKQYTSTTVTLIFVAASQIKTSISFVVVLQKCVGGERLQTDFLIAVQSLFFRGLSHALRICNVLLTVIFGLFGGFLTVT